MEQFVVLSNQKLVSFLQSVLLNQCSGKAIRRILNVNLCRVNGRIERFGSSEVKKGDIVQVASSWQSFFSSTSLKRSISILYEDEDLLFIDKPVGWECNEDNCKRMFGSQVALVHRLDKNTTGVLVLSKKLTVQKELKTLFAERKVEKSYLAIVDGIVSDSEGVRESYLVRKKIFDGQTIWGSSSRGLHAITRWKTLARGNNSSFLLCLPFTGRTHQIRVHLAELGHPIIIDRQYAATYRCSVFAPRTLLHAYELSIRGLTIKSFPPLDVQNCSTSLGIDISEYLP